jgi:cyclic pyranopterin phosphate synthase
LRAPQPRIGPMTCTTPLVDAFNRRISYLRLSVTDRCD